VFTAASVLQAHTLEDARKHLSDSTAGKIPNRVRRSRSYHYPSTEPRLALKTTFLLRFWPPIDDRANCLLYMAERSDGDGVILVKFAR
jgi:hypothetical protein